MIVTRKSFLMGLVCIMALLMAACGEGQQDASGEPAAVDNAEASDQEEEQTIVGEGEVEEVESPVEFQAVAGQEMTFPSSDGTELQGIYYPASVSDAPLIIMMHWALGNQMDYVEMAYWLQNTGLGGETESSANTPWLDPSWFPPVDADKTYAVFTFTFRGCEDSCQSFPREEWLMDAQSAVEFAYNLEGIDQENILVVGASIGADGAADGCLFLNQQHPGSCRGAFSLSAGNYLTLDYADVVAQLSQDTIPAWCLYSDNDAESARVCGVFEADNYTANEIEGGHGMQLVRPESDPNPLRMLLEFISNTIE